MDMYKLKWTRLQGEIFRLLCIKAGLKLNLRKIARLLKVSPTAVSKSLSELEKEELIIIKRSKELNLFSIELNRNNPKAIEKKLIENLNVFMESGLSEFLLNQFAGCTIVLFGSYARGEDILAELGDNNSDIDIAIVGSKGKKIDIKDFENLLEREIRINFYESWKEINKNLKDNILNGIIIGGHVDL